MHFAFTIFALAFAVYFVRQCRKPTGWIGRAIASNMNSRHAMLTNWALEEMSTDPRTAMLDIGCGGGATVRRFAETATAAKVYGLDYASASVATARRTNEAQIAAGRALIVRGSVSQLPFADASFDLVTAFETHYYWPNLDDALREIGRVIRPGGTFVLAVEAYKQDLVAGYMLGLVMRLLGGRILTVEEHRDLLTQAGLSDARVDTQRSRGWLRAVGHKPPG